MNLPLSQAYIHERYDLAIFKTYPYLRKPMSGAFNIAWSVLKADPSQQLLAPQMVTSTGPLQQHPRSGDFNIPSYVESAERFMPQETMPPAITGMMQRQGVQQPALGQYAQYQDSGRDIPNPVEREVRPNPYSTQALLQQLGLAPMSQSTTGSPLPVGVTPYENVMQAM